ncbi:hypothetical protein ACOMHN_059048 [Nucella lapillus]
MLGTIRLLLFVAFLWQGPFASADTTTAPNNDININLPEAENGSNIVLGPDGVSILATLERLQKEHDQLRQDMQQSQTQMLALIEGVKEENSLLSKQQDYYQAMMSKMVADVGQKVGDSLQEMNQQVQSQMMELVSSVGEVKGQQEAVMNQAGMMKTVLDVVQDFEDEFHNVTCQLDKIRERMESVEAGVLKLQDDGSNYALQQSAAEQRVDALESLLQGVLQRNTSQSPSPTRLASSTTPTPTTPAPTTSSGQFSTEESHKYLYAKRENQYTEATVQFIPVRLIFLHRESHDIVNVRVSSDRHTTFHNRESHDMVNVRVSSDLHTTFHNREDQYMEPPA